MNLDRFQEICRSHTQLQDPAPGLLAQLDARAALVHPTLSATDLAWLESDPTLVEATAADMEGVPADVAERLAVALDLVYDDTFA